MPELSAGVIAAATVAAFLAGGAWYAALGDQLVTTDGDTPEVPSWTYAVELVRCLVLATVVVGLAVRAEVDHGAGGLVLGLVLWVGFPLVLFTGAVVHEGTPVRVAAVHAGDWLVKLVLVSVIAAVWG